jgi:drug/metabolite transporter (DMT)-like permease
VGVTIVLGLVGALAYAVADLFNTRLARRLDAATVLSWSFLIAVTILLPVTFAIDGNPFAENTADVAASAGAGVLYVLALGAMLLGLRVGSLSVIAPLAALEGGVAGVISIAMGEQLPALAYPALVLGVVGGVLAASERRNDTDHVALAPCHGVGVVAGADGRLRRVSVAAGAGWGF